MLAAGTSSMLGWTLKKEQSKMSKHLPTTKYFMHPQYTYTPAMVNRDIQAALPGLSFGPYGSYDNALGRSLIEAKLGKKFFTPAAALDPDVARFQLDKNLP
jgi:hypothetical protein